MFGLVFANVFLGVVVSVAVVAVAGVVQQNTTAAIAHAVAKSACVVMLVK
jgi:hypothetical protein